jgi:hypothetical protein
VGFGILNWVKTSSIYYGLGRLVTVRALAELLRCGAIPPAYVFWHFAWDWGLGALGLGLAVVIYNRR